MKRALVVIVGLCLLNGCAGDHTANSEFVKAEIEWNLQEPKESKGKRVITDASQAAKLASFFNFGDAIRVARQPLTAPGAGKGYTVTLIEKSGTERKLIVSEDFTGWTAGAGRDYWGVRTGTKEFLKELVDAEAGKGK